MPKENPSSFSIPYFILGILLGAGILYALNAGGIIQLSVAPPTDNSIVLNYIIPRNLTVAQYKNGQFTQNFNYSSFYLRSIVSGDEKQDNTFCNSTIENFMNSSNAESNVSAIITDLVNTSKYNINGTFSQKYVSDVEGCGLIYLALGYKNGTAIDNNAIFTFIRSSEEPFVEFASFGEYDITFNRIKLYDNNLFNATLDITITDVSANLLTDFTELLYVQGYSRGRQSGYTLGYNDGYNEGYNDGFNDGYETGLLENPLNNIINMSLHFPEEQICTNYTTALDGYYERMNDYNSTDINCGSETLFVIPFEIPFGNILNNLTFYYDTSVPNNFNVYLIKSTEINRTVKGYGDSLTDSLFVTGASDYVWVFDQYIPNGSYYFIISGNQIFKLGGSDWNDSVQLYYALSPGNFVLESMSATPRFALGMQNITFTEDEVSCAKVYSFQSLYYSLRSWSEGLLDVQLALTLQQTNETFCGHTDYWAYVSDYNWSMSWFKFNTRNWDTNGNFILGAEQDLLGNYIAYNFEPNHSYTITFGNMKLYTFDDFGLNAYIDMELLINEEVFKVSAFWIISS